MCRRHRVQIQMHWLVLCPVCFTWDCASVPYFWCVPSRPEKNMVHESCWGVNTLPFSSCLRWISEKKCIYFWPYCFGMQYDGTAKSVFCVFESGYPIMVENTHKFWYDGTAKSVFLYSNQGIQLWLKTPINFGAIWNCRMSEKKCIYVFL